MAVLVIGDIMLDISYIGTSNRLAPESPVPVIKITDTVYGLGGAGNVANNLNSMNGKTFIISVIGNDQNGNKIKELLNQYHICNHLVIDNRVTTSKNRVYCQNKLISRYDIETNEKINEIIENEIITQVTEIIDTFDVVVLSDYMKGMLTDNLCKKIIQICNENNKMVFVDPKDTDHTKYIGCSLVKPNRNEAEHFINRKINLNNGNDIMDALNKINHMFGSKYCLLTLGENGLIIFDGIDYKHIESKDKINIIDVTGAGDMVLSSFTYKYLKTDNLIESAKFANYCGMIKVKNLGTYVLSQYDILCYDKNDNKILNYNNLSEIINIIRHENKKIVFTNGCFDILHYGHLSYLNNAKKLGDILIVGINSDESIKRIKGNKRPIQNETYRLNQMKCLECIDFLVMFNENNPLKIIEIIKPDILVKGGDYKVENILGKEYAKETIVLNYEAGISSTNIIEKISNQTTE
ncbi:carbohydrate kinase pfkb with cytidyltransferase-like domain [Fadolivirus algeromassiliense]|jgi:D-beta-D-heptose 7-phosphate kinase/D-beta-D-heptose 1-phosphate adenosyltransferase|uniref:Carbohydrate kinase pfkb with cytidyltransferase-like domain n=1 Tax=Fadolivirus FV1/VV64 TaxID=3070911 RepID=A0A7D3QV10_9VIRU|nr:carbohydrate kinase pfkb with cytidyltransferase-like domain [Fadolivirus algeromassiliense]QKF93884.1 carbohydrate kinase pfkb with cytidyltransferase-like domain [Fadolivirus FV1/VV64]